MNKNVSWLLVLSIWSVVLLILFVTYRLVKIQTYDLQKDVLINTPIIWDEQETHKNVFHSELVRDNESLKDIVSDPIHIKSRSALIEVGESYFKIFDSHNNEQPIDQWMTLVLQNHLTIHLTLTPDTSLDWELALGKDKLRVQFRSELDARKDILSRKKQGKVSIQLTSFSTEEFLEAIRWTQYLIQEGYYAYLHRTEEKFNNHFR